MRHDDQCSLPSIAEAANVIACDISRGPRSPCASLIQSPSGQAQACQGARCFQGPDELCAIFSHFKCWKPTMRHDDRCSAGCCPRVSASTKVCRMAAAGASSTALAAAAPAAIKTPPLPLLLPLTVLRGGSSTPLHSRAPAAFCTSCRQTKASELSTFDI